jgi:hypothetical protein
MAGNDRVCAAARSKWPPRTIVNRCQRQSSLPDDRRSPEVFMTQRAKRPSPPPAPTYPSPPEESKRQIEPTEPIEVLGLHKNTGQKDHKGAR